jgi:guanylate kinase
MESENVLVAIGGPSGTGKTYLMNSILASNPFAFRVLRQVTTRPQRSGEGDTYDFIDEEKYRLLHDDLVCRVNFNNCNYGTIVPDSLNGKIGLVIASEGGMLDLISAKHKYSVLIKIGLDHSNLPRLQSVVNREGRDVAFLKQELKVLDLCDIKFNVTNFYTTVEEAVNAISKSLSEQSDRPGVMESLNRLHHQDMFVSKSEVTPVPSR